jgi:dephospho-CoA kinase
VQFSAETIEKRAQVVQPENENPKRDPLTESLKMLFNHLQEIAFNDNESLLKLEEFM